MCAIRRPVSASNSLENPSILDAKMLPPGINRKMLAGFVAEVDGRETVLRAMIERFERRYGSLTQLDARLE
jgi:hypothetical protein